MSLNPKTSNDKNIGVKYVLVAEANTKQYPKATTIIVGNEKIKLITTPKLAPIAKSGVTSPPLKPTAVHKAVNINFKIKS